MSSSQYQKMFCPANNSILEKAELLPRHTHRNIRLSS